MGHLKYLKKVVNIAVTHDWLDKNPFQNFRCTTREVRRESLTLEELQLLAEKPFAMRRLAEVRDIFVFSCYTGYAYSDVLKLTPDHILTGINGKKWIITQRNKTDTKSNVPLLPPALAVLRKYAEDPECLGGPPTAGQKQPEAQCLPEGNCRRVRHQKAADLSHCAAHLRYNRHAYQRRAHRNGQLNAGP